MKPPYVTLILGACVTLTGGLPDLLSAQTNGAAPGGGALPSRSPSLLAPPMPTPGPSPVDFFRKLLVMTPVQREQALADKSESARAVIRSKLAEYEALPERERNLRLRRLQLYRYLVPLMALAPETRGERAQFVPGAIRPLVEARLKEWDKLTRDQQRAALQHQSVIHYFCRLPEDMPAALHRQPIDIEKITPTLAPQQVEREMTHWRALPPEQRRAALQSLTEKARLQSQRTLWVFSSFTEEQRARCVENFNRLTQMSIEEQRRFLANADRWQQMNLEERKLWRAMIQRLYPAPRPPLPSPRPGAAAPPMPHGWDFAAASLPPLPAAGEMPVAADVSPRALARSHVDMDSRP